MVAVTDLYVRPAKTVLFDYLVAQLQAANVPITDWEIGAVQRTILEQCEAPAAFDLVSNALVTIASYQWQDTAVGDWLTDLAHYVWELDRIPGTFAVQDVTLACAAGYGPYVIQPDRELVAGDGKLYTANTGGTLGAGPSTLSLQATARQIGPMAGLVSRLSDSLPGVTVSAAAVATVGGVIRYGSKDESDAALLARILGRWPSLSAYATSPRVVRWALAASPGNVTRVKLAPTTWPNVANVTIAGPSGGVSGGVTTAVQAYVDAHAAIGKVYSVQSATTAAIAAGGTVWCYKGTVAAVQAAAQTAWAAYLGTTTIGANVSFAKLIQCVMDAGAYDYRGPVLGLYLGTLVPQDYLLSSTQVPILPSGSPTLATQLTWYDNTP